MNLNCRPRGRRRHAVARRQRRSQKLVAAAASRGNALAFAREAAVLVRSRVDPPQETKVRAAPAVLAGIPELTVNIVSATSGQHQAPDRHGLSAATRSSTTRSARPITTNSGRTISTGAKSSMIGMRPIILRHPICSKVPPGACPRRQGTRVQRRDRTWKDWRRRARSAEQRRRQPPIQPHGAEPGHKWRAGHTEVASHEPGVTKWRARHAGRSPTHEPGVTHDGGRAATP